MMLELSFKVAVEKNGHCVKNYLQPYLNFASKHCQLKRDEEGWEWQYAPLGLVLVSSNIALPVYTC